MNYLKRKLLGHVFMCGGGEGGGGGSDPNSLAANDAAQFGTSDAPAGATGGVAAGPGNGPAVSGLTESQTDKALANFDTQQAGGKVSSEDIAAAGGTPAPFGSALPTAGGIVQGATGSKSLGAGANMLAGAIPGVNVINGILGMGNLAMGAANELAAASQPSAMNGPSLVGNNGVGAAQGIQDGGFNNQTGQGGVPASNVGGQVAADSGAPGDTMQSTPTGIIGSAATPAAPATPPTTSAAPEVNYGLFGKLGLGGWSSAAKRYAIKKGAVTV